MKTLWVKAEVYIQLEEEAKKMGITLEELIIDAIEYKINKLEL